MPQTSDDFRLYVGVATAAALGMFLCLMGMMMLRAITRYRRRGLAAVRTRFSVESGRALLSLDDFYAEYYAGRRYPRTIVAEVLLRFAAAAHVPAGALRPEDSFFS